VLTCEAVAERLPAIVDAGEEAHGPVIRHVERCLRCQAELAQYRRLLRVLHQLRTEVIEPAPGLLADILAAIEAAGERRAIRSLLRGRRVAYLGGIAAATAAGAAAGVIVAVSRSRRRAVRLAG
jgi:hypothetical protein